MALPPYELHRRSRWRENVRPREVTRPVHVLRPETARNGVDRRKKESIGCNAFECDFSCFRRLLRERRSWMGSSCRTLKVRVLGCRIPWPLAGEQREGEGAVVRQQGEKNEREERKIGPKK
ncbi:hypothetical protein JCGZ_12143 [Jatropha curcas]|uniref:Uncharacterized protein n=1 Tax=Jatropha curcas TaxID=180498 RepID=A0A067K9E6_JATCU|nr:hypothetical protein JCGZ_12143 [Jatropha curcas]